MNKFYFYLAVFFLLNASTFAQRDTLQPVSLTPVRLDVVKLSGDKTLVPLSVTQIEVAKTNPIQQQLSLQEYLQEVPGLFAQNAQNFSQDLRISIRGFGARAAFGIRGIKIIVDGIPETTPDGQGQLDNLSLNLVKTIEVIRGPSSSLYGNASGGVINIKTIDSLSEGIAKADVTFGSFGMQQYQLLSGISEGKTTALFQGNYTATNGYRAQSRFKNYAVSTKITHRFSEKTTLKLQGNYTNSPLAEDAGGLTLDEVQTDRSQARQRNVDFDTGETIQQIKTGASITHKFDEQFQLQAYTFYSYRDFSNKLPFEDGGIVTLKRNYAGAGSNVTFKHHLFNNINELQAGVDYALQQDQRKRFQNLEGIQGNLSFEQLEEFSALGLYVLDQYYFGKILFRLGARFDINNLKAEDRFLTDGNNTDDIQLNAFSPSIGMQYAFSETTSVHTAFSTGFETPALSELSANPDGSGGFNTELLPQRSTNTEVGFTYKTAQQFFEAVVFYITTKDDLVPFEVSDFPDRTFYRNAGSTHRKGLEVSFKQQLFPGFSLRSAYTFSDFTYNEYRINEEDFRDNTLPALPVHKLHTAITFRKKRLSLQLEMNYTGKMYAEDSNATQISAATLLNFNSGYTFKLGSTTLLPFFGINNLTNAGYYDSIRINAFGNRYYEPGADRNYFGGVRFQF
ncbi:TonB-dependent receptor family protein [Cochleicola gelatinilyticus]|uniref:TonB-dependent receptor n=1 Tax=Cochleicola gelatinilyticus TaxID=1763537 RepID=A0A167F5E5_9FLAO|nr:TonB-dependent receptor [Cochleicola gelatinilyticus]OAB76215.1 hypothetical protein ULVI_14290 [Cochleicola gelatinilyticus]